jgi:hypothetical protein
MAEMHADGSGGLILGGGEREEKLTVECAPWRWVGGRRGTAWRASSGGGGAWLVAQREVRSTGGARGGIGGAVLWPEVPVCVEVLLSGNGGAGWLAVGSEQRTTVRGGAWRQWEAHQLRGGPGRWLVEVVIDEVAVEEVVGDGGGGLALRADTNKKQRCEGEERQVDRALLNDVSQRIRTRAACTAGGHRQHTFTVRGVVRARVR